MRKTMNVGLIGFGFIGKLHTLAYRDIPLCVAPPRVLPVLEALLRRRVFPDDPAVQGAGFALATADPELFFACPLDVIDICTPNFRHLEQTRQALATGTAIYCEKPLANSLEAARAMVVLAEQTEALTHVAFMLRYLPAIRQMKSLLEAGVIGEVFHFRGELYHGGYLDPQRALSWRLQSTRAGGGAFMDLGVHLVDLVHYLLGGVTVVQAVARTFIQERPDADSGVRRPVDVDDWMHCTLHLESGAVGTLEATRMAAGSRDATSFAIYGSRGALVFRATDPNFVSWYDVKSRRQLQGELDLPSPQGERPITELWPTEKYSQGTMVNAHLACAYDFLLDVAEGKPSPVDFRAGLATQEVIEAAYRSAEHGGARIGLPLG